MVSSANDSHLRYDIVYAYLLLIYVPLDLKSEDDGPGAESGEPGEETEPGARTLNL